MEAKPTDSREMRDDELNDALEAHAGEELDGLSLQNQRLARIQEYEEAAVARADPFGAVIGMGNAHFQRIFEHYGSVILDELDSREHSLEELRELGPDIRLLVKLRNSIETDLAVQLADAGTQSAQFRQRRKGNVLDTTVTTSKRVMVPKR